MMKNYFIVLMCLVSSLAMAQTVEIVEDYYDGEKGYGVMPNDLVSNSTMMMFSGAEAMMDRGFMGKFYFYEPFVTDGTADNFTKIDLNVGVDVGMQSSPSKYFIVNDVIYFIANDGTNEGIYKVTDLAGTSELVTADWIPGSTPVPHVFESNKVEFPGQNPADATDENNYILEWNGDGATLPTVPIGHAGLYNIQGSNGFGAISSGGRNYYVMAAKDPNNPTNGTQLCVKYASFRGHGVEFTSLNGDATVSDYPRNFTVMGFEVYFDDGKGSIWKVDLTSGYSATLVSDANAAITTGSNTTKVMGVYDGKIVFSAYASGESTFSIFTYDPTASVDPVTKLNDGFEIRNLGGLVVLDDKMYFEGQHVAIPYDPALNSNPLWCYDGTILSQLATDLTSVSEPHVFDNKIYFSAEDTDGAFAADGVTPASTYKELFVYNPSGATDIAPAFKASSISVSPNPSYGFVNVTGAVEGTTYEIYSLSGQLVEAGLVMNGTVDYEVNAGVYILKVGTEVSKIIVK